MLYGIRSLQNYTEIFVTFQPVKGGINNAILSSNQIFNSRNEVLFIHSSHFITIGINFLDFAFNLALALALILDLFLWFMRLLSLILRLIDKVLYLRSIF